MRTFKKCVKSVWKKVSVFVQLKKKQSINEPAGPNKRYGSGKFDFLTMFTTAICCSSFNFDAYTPLEIHESLGDLSKYSTNKIRTIAKIKRKKLPKQKTVVAY